MEEKNKKWVWKNYSWIIVLIMYYSWSAVLSALYSGSINDYSKETGFILIFLFVIILIAIFTDREWKVYQRILWAIGVWLLQPFLSLIIGFLIASIYFDSDKPWLFDRIVTTLGALPFIIWAMRRSKLFVKNKISEE